LNIEFFPIAIGS